MKTGLKAYGYTLILFLIADAIWLSTMIPRFYRPQLESLLAPTPSFGAAMAFYFLYPIGLIILVILPALQNRYSITKALLLSMLHGLVAYGTYDLTNQATLKDWPLIVTLVDTTWGGLLTGSVGALTTLLLRRRSQAGVQQPTSILRDF